MHLTALLHPSPLITLPSPPLSLATQHSLPLSADGVWSADVLHTVQPSVTSASHLERGAANAVRSVGAHVVPLETGPSEGSSSSVAIPWPSAAHNPRFEDSSKLVVLAAGRIWLHKSLAESPSLDLITKGLAAELWS